MTQQMDIDGVEVAFSEGETVLEVAQRIKKTFPRYATTHGWNRLVDAVFASLN